MLTLILWWFAILSAFVAGFLLSAIFRTGQQADLAAACAACEASYQARLKQNQIKLDANFQEWWEGERIQTCTQSHPVMPKYNAVEFTP